MRITLGCVWTDNNKGDAAIALATLQELSKAFPDAELTGIAMNAEGDPNRDFDHEFRYERERHGLKVHGAIYPLEPPFSGNKYLTHARRILLSVKYHLFLVAVRLLKRRARWLLRPSARPAFDAIADCDLVVMKGGGYVFGSPRGFLWDITRVFRPMYTALLARLLGKPYILCASTICNLRSGYSRRLMRKLIRDSILTVVREEMTLEHLREVGVDLSRVRLGVDLAYALPPPPMSETDALAERLGIRPDAVNVGATIVGRYAGFPPDSHHGRLGKAFVEGMAEICDRLVEEHGADVWLMPHVLECGIARNDPEVTVQVHGMVRHPDRVHLVEGDYHPEELMGLYARMRFMIACRFHSGIFASMVGTPFVAISYTGTKTPGIMKMLGLSDAAFDIESLDYDRMYQLVSDCLSGTSSIWDGMDQRVAELSEEARAKHRLYRDAYERWLEQHPG